MDKLSIVKRYFSFSLGIWINALISFFTTPIVTWLINPTEFGKATMFSSAYSVIILLVLSGTPSAFMRFFHQVSDKERATFLWSSLLFPMLFSVLSFVIILIFRKDINVFLVDDSNSVAAFLLILTMATGIFQTFNQTIIRMNGRAFTYSFIQIFSSATNAAFIILYALFVKRNFYAILYAQLFSNIATLLLGLSLEHSYWFPIKFEWKKAIDALKFGYPLAFASIFWWLLHWTDRFVLRMFTNFTEIGLYSAAFKIISIMNVFTSGFSTLWYPFAYEQYEKNPHNDQIFSKSFNYVSLISFSLGLLVLSFKDVIFLLFAKSYRSAASMSPFLLLSPVLTTAGIISARGIDFSKKTYWFIISNASAAIFNLIGNFVLVPLLGARGAALSTGLSFIILVVIETVASSKLYPVTYNLKSFCISTIVFCIAAFIHSFSGNVVFSVISSLLGLLLVFVIYRSQFVELMKGSFTLLAKLVKN